MMLFDGECSPRDVAPVLDRFHYLGATGRGFAWSDAHGVLVLAPPTARNLPGHWLDLTRWCLYGGKNSGSRQWSRVRRHIIAEYPDATTVVSYSDPSQGHDGALYRASGWVWAPTWHRLRPPPSGNGTWSTKPQSVKDRWVFCLRPDARRPDTLRIKDTALERRYPWLRWREPRTRRGVCVPGTGGYDRRRWLAEGGECYEHSCCTVR